MWSSGSENGIGLDYQEDWSVEVNDKKLVKAVQYLHDMNMQHRRSAVKKSSEQAYALAKNTTAIALYYVEYTVP